LIATFLVDVFVVVGHIIGHPDIQTLDFLDFICGILGSYGVITRNRNMNCTAVSHFGSCNLNNVVGCLFHIHVKMCTGAESGRLKHLL